MSTLLNGFDIELPKEGLIAYAMEMPDPERLRELRDAERDEWFFHWRDGTAYCVPEKPTPQRQHGKAVTLTLTNHHHLGLLAARINHVLPALFPKYEALRQRPFTFLGRKHEIVESITANWGKLSPLIRLFKIRPRFELDARLYELQDGDVRLGLFVSVSTKWEILASVSDLAAAGIPVSGLFVVRRNPAVEERRLVGEVSAIDGNQVRLRNSFDGIDSIENDKVWVEGNKSSFKRCLTRILGARFVDFERERERHESRFMSGPGLETICKTMEDEVFKKNNKVDLWSSQSCRVLYRIRADNVNDYKTVVDVSQGDYCFDPAKRKRSAYAWQGLQQYGPYSRDTFHAKSPRILVVVPDKTTGTVAQFIAAFRHGVSSVSNSQFAGGFGKVFHLHNPEFVTVPVSLVGTQGDSVCKAYRKTIEDALRQSTDYQAAMVAILDEHSQLEGRLNPYLHAKSMLLTAGIPVQEFRIATASASPFNLQYILQSMSVSLYAKMGGVPWTIDQGLAVDDEVVIGMGTGEVSGSRFEQRQRFVGITTVFRGDGNYLLGHLSRDCTYEEYPAVLEESTAQVLKELRERNGWQNGNTVRVVFHAHKPLKRIEIARIVKRSVDAAGQGLNVQFAFLNLAKDHCFRVTDPQAAGRTARNSNESIAKMVPPRGRIVQLGRFTRLLCTKGPTLVKRSVTPLPAPVLIHLHQDSTYRDLQYLSEQVLKFTNLSWRGTMPSEDPVTVYYSSLIGSLLGKLRDIDGWSVNALNIRLRHSMWFL